jgi:hypothetical protein
MCNIYIYGDYILSVRSDVVEAVQTPQARDPVESHVYQGCVLVEPHFIGSRGMGSPITTRRHVGLSNHESLIRMQ